MMHEFSTAAQMIFTESRFAHHGPLRMLLAVQKVVTHGNQIFADTS